MPSPNPKQGWWVRTTIKPPEHFASSLRSEGAQQSLPTSAQCVSSHSGGGGRGAGGDGGGELDGGSGVGDGDCCKGGEGVGGEGEGEGGGAEGGGGLLAGLAVGAIWAAACPSEVLAAAAAAPAVDPSPSPAW